MPLSNPIQPRFERSFSAVVNLALPKYLTTRANQPELPAVGLGVKDYQGSAVNANHLMDCGWERNIFVCYGD
jgi:predicted benzoate:H+ symporter BenE